jgi:hypothetical protein
MSLLHPAFHSQIKSTENVSPFSHTKEKMRKILPSRCATKKAGDVSSYPISKASKPPPLTFENRIKS